MSVAMVNTSKQKQTQKMRASIEYVGKNIY